MRNRYDPPRQTDAQRDRRLEFPHFRNYNNSVKVSFDQAKRARSLAERGLDVADAAVVFEGPTATQTDDRHDYGEPRFIIAGLLAGRVVVLVWTPRDGSTRVISMRHAHADEAAWWRERMDRSG